MYATSMKKLTWGTEKVKRNIRKEAQKKNMGNGTGEKEQDKMGISNTYDRKSDYKKGTNE